MLTALVFHNTHMHTQNNHLKHYFQQKKKSYMMLWKLQQKASSNWHWFNSHNMIVLATMQLAAIHILVQIWDESVSLWAWLYANFSTQWWNNDILVMCFTEWTVAAMRFNILSIPEQALA
jgi:hypothetical protein